MSKTKFMITDKVRVSKKVMKEAFQLMCTAKSQSEVYEENFKITSKYVHATSRGHEAIQLAVGMQLNPQDFAFPYYRDDSMLLGMGVTSYELMLQLLGKRDDPFSGGRTYYSHPSLRDDHRPKIPHQSSATGMQAIPATGVGLGIQYKEKLGFKKDYEGDNPVVVCSLGDACVTEGEVAEAFQMAALRQLPVLYVVQDNEWDISAHVDEVRAQNAYEYIKGFKGIEAASIDGTDFVESYNTVKEALKYVRKRRQPFLIHATCPLLNHHTSGVRMEFYRDDLEEARKDDPYPKMKLAMLEAGFEPDEIAKIEQDIEKVVYEAYRDALAADDPTPEDLFTHDLIPTTVTEEQGNRQPDNAEEVVMVDCALHAIEELMKDNQEALLYGQDVGLRLGGVFREAANLAKKFGTERVFNTPIQEAFIIGSTVGMSAVGLKPFVEVQFADYIWPGLNQLFTEVSRSCYLTNGKWPVSMVLRVPIGAYGSGGPYHSSSVESVVTNIKGIKIAYPSNGADLKGLLKAAYHDPNPVVVFEHKGLYWSKVPGTKAAKVKEPAADYILPLGKGAIALEAGEEQLEMGDTLSVVTYGMGVHWALNAAKDYPGQVEIVDLRSLYPLDEELVFESVRRNNKCLVLTEEPVNNTFARGLAGRISEHCFTDLDAPVMVMGAENMPAIPLNSTLEATMLPNAEKVSEKIGELLNW